MTHPNAPSFEGEIDFETGADRGGGAVAEAYLLRVGDGFTERDKFRITAGSSKGRRLTVDIRDPLLLPQFMARLALEVPEGDETAEELDQRLALRDDLAKAFEAAASTLRAAPKR